MKFNEKIEITINDEEYKILSECSAKRSISISNIVENIVSNFVSQYNSEKSEKN